MLRKVDNWLTIHNTQTKSHIEAGTLPKNNDSIKRILPTTKEVMNYDMICNYLDYLNYARTGIFLTYYAHALNYTMYSLHSPFCTYYTTLAHPLHITVQTCYNTDMLQYRHVTIQTCYNTDMLQYRHVTIQTCYNSDMLQYRHVTVRTCHSTDMSQ